MGLTRRREGAKEEKRRIGLGLTRGREFFGGGEFFGLVSREGAKEERDLFWVWREGVKGGGGLGV